MDYAYTFGDEKKLYLNVTNRCTNRCVFCVRYGTEGLCGSILWGEEEPDFPMLQQAILKKGPLDSFEEFIWCGYGEPTCRIELIRQAGAWLRSCGARIRLNTNGHACLIHGRDALPELATAVDAISVSLNAPACGRYLELCRPDSLSPQVFWDAMLDFLRRSPKYIEDVQASVVGFALSIEEIEQSRLLASSLGITKFRVR